jgi:CheY-like chemotaxis protein
MVLILIVDDNSDLRYSAKIALKNVDKSYEFIEAKDGQECIDYILKLKENNKKLPDLILMDIMMPILDGVMASKKLFELGFKIPIIFLTAKTDAESLIASKKYGVSYIEKPFDSKFLDLEIKKNIH